MNRLSGALSFKYVIITVHFAIDRRWLPAVVIIIGGAETLARGGGIINHHVIAYSLSNISAKNYQNRLMCVEVILCYISVCFFGDTV